MSVMAEDGEVLFGIEFLVSACGHVAHGHGDAGFDVGRGEFPWFAHIDEAGLVFAEESGCVGGGDFEFEHGSSLVPEGIDRTDGHGLPSVTNGRAR